MKKALRSKLNFPRVSIPVWFRDLIISLILQVIAAVLCLVLRGVSGDTNYVSMIYILAVFLTARLTNGYIYGIAFSIISVLSVNFIFTYPYFKFNFTLTGYPLAILSMLAVSLTTSALTSQAKQSQEMHIESEREKTRSNLLRSVSHDIRTPLTSILGAISALEGEHGTLSESEKRELLKDAKDDAQWLIRMVENLLAVTRIDDGHAQITKRLEPAEEVAADSVAKFKKRFPMINVDVTVPHELLMVPMDPVLIEQVILNLLENSAIHGQTVTLLKLTVCKKDDSAVFTICDNGKGIPADILKKIRSDSFIPPSGDDSEGKRSMGIGLSVCRTIIFAHGGSICADNMPGAGAVFSFSIPLKEEIK